MKMPNLRLDNDETVLFSMREHPKALFIPVLATLSAIALAILAAVQIPADLLNGWLHIAIYIGLGILAIKYALVPFLAWVSTRFVVTNRQIVILSGVLTKKTHSSQLSRVSDLNVERDILDRIWGCGTIVVFNAAGGISDANDNMNRVTLHDVPNVLEVEDKIKNLVFNRE